MNEREIVRKIKEYENKISDLSDEKNHLINVIDELDTSRISIRARKENMEGVFCNRVASFEKLSVYRSRGVIKISEKMKEYNSIYASSSYVWKAIQTIQNLIDDISRNIEKRMDRVSEIDSYIQRYEEKIRILKQQKARMEG